jgi:hypothetical protein
VVVTVHERIDGLGYIVRVLEDGGLRRSVRYPVGTCLEAEALAKSLVRYIDVGCDIEPLFGDGGGANEHP